MIEITDKASRRISEFYQQHEIASPMRVTVVEGCSGKGKALGLVIDNKQEDDALVAVRSGITILVNRDLLARCGKIRVDFQEPGDANCSCGSGGGFNITTTVPLPELSTTDTSRCRPGCCC